jgi:hypothetical protein
MENTLEMTTTSPPTVSETEAQQAADAYLATALGAEYRALSGFSGQGRWYFRIGWQCPNRHSPYGVGKLAVDAHSGAVQSLTDEQLHETREWGAVQAANERGELARDAQGYVLRYQAQRQATTWLSDHLSMHFSATDGLFVPLARPLWQFAIRFRLPSVGELKPLGVIDVDALTGQVTSLSRHQQHTIQERVCEIIRHRTPAAAA